MCYYYLEDFFEGLPLLQFVGWVRVTHPVDEKNFFCISPAFSNCLHKIIDNQTIQSTKIATAAFPPNSMSLLRNKNLNELLDKTVQK